MGNHRLGDRLDRARRRASLSHSELWFRYLELGGIAGPLELEAYLFGALRPTMHEHDLLVHALNERFAELGRGHPVPYLDARITLGDRLGPVCAVLWDIDPGPGEGSWDRACATCTEALSMTGAGVTLLDGDLRRSLGSSDRVTATIEVAFNLGEGPGVDAGRLGVIVQEPDLATSGRWPTFAARALDAGVAAVFAFPLRAEAATIGTLHLYRDETGPLSAPQLADALAVAALVTHTVLILEADAPPRPRN